MSATRILDPWSEASAMAALHVCRSQGELDAAFAAELARLLPDVPFALTLAADGHGRQRVQVAGGGGDQFARGPDGGTGVALVPPAERLPIAYRDQALGELLLGAVPSEGLRELLQALLVHYGTALVNITLHAEARQATDHYCASLQALEEGIVLFQEQDPAAVLARLLSLATSMMQATAGALYVLREVGDADSGLALEQSLGIPESLLQTFRAVPGSQWPDSLLGQPTQLLQPNADGGIAVLDPACVPPMLQNVVVLPMRYHGVDAGLCVLFNAAIDAADVRDHLSRVTSLGQLGAALLHRLRLEALTAQNRSIARELQIAETIQKRLLPTKAPTTSEYDFAWCSIAAQYIGGDYLDLLTSDLGDIYAVVADASGHGINSALLMSSFRSTYRAEAPWREPDELAAALNGEVVHEVGATGMFITAVSLRIERETRQLCLTSAGHNPVMLYRAATGAVESIDSHGPPFGIVPGADYSALRTQLEPGDLLLLYTDGITEASAADGTMFGEERLVALLRRHAQATPEALVTAIRQSLAGFTGRDHHDDDVSVTVIRVRDAAVGG